MRLECLQTRPCVTKSTNDAINAKHNTQEHKSCDNRHTQIWTSHRVNSIHWIVWWTLICVYYCQSRKCSWYAAPFLPIIFPDEEPWSRDIGGGSAEVSARAPGHTRLLVTMEDVSPAPDIPGLWASRPGPASPADDNNYCYKPIKDLFKDFFEQLLVLFIIIAKRKH